MSARRASCSPDHFPQGGYLRGGDSDFVSTEREVDELHVGGLKDNLLAKAQLEDGGPRVHLRRTGSLATEVGVAGDFDLDLKVWLRLERGGSFEGSRGLLSSVAKDSAELSAELSDADREDHVLLTASDIFQREQYTAAVAEFYAYLSAVLRRANASRTSGDGAPTLVMDEDTTTRSAAKNLPLLLGPAPTEAQFSLPAVAPHLQRMRDRHTSLTSVEWFQPPKVSDDIPLREHDSPAARNNKAPFTLDFVFQPDQPSPLKMGTEETFSHTLETFFRLCYAALGTNVRDLVRLVKRWLKRKGLGTPTNRGLNSISVQMLVLWFLYDEYSADVREDLGPLETGMLDEEEGEDLESIIQVFRLFTRFLVWLCALYERVVVGGDKRMLRCWLTENGVAGLSEKLRKDLPVFNAGPSPRDGRRTLPFACRAEKVEQPWMHTWSLWLSVVGFELGKGVGEGDYVVEERVGSGFVEDRRRGELVAEGSSPESPPREKRGRLGVIERLGVASLHMTRVTDSVPVLSDLSKLAELSVRWVEAPGLNSRDEDQSNLQNSAPSESFPAFELDAAFETTVFELDADSIFVGEEGFEGTNSFPKLGAGSVVSVEIPPAQHHGSEVFAKKDFVWAKVVSATEATMHCVSRRGSRGVDHAKTPTRSGEDEDSDSVVPESANGSSSPEVVVPIGGGNGGGKFVPKTGESKEVGGAGSLTRVSSAVTSTGSGASESSCMLLTSPEATDDAGADDATDPPRPPGHQQPHLGCCRSTILFPPGPPPACPPLPPGGVPMYCVGGVGSRGAVPIYGGGPSFFYGGHGMLPCGGWNGQHAAAPPAVLWGRWSGAAAGQYEGGTMHPPMPPGCFFGTSFSATPTYVHTNDHGQWAAADDSACSQWATAADGRISEGGDHVGTTSRQGWNLEVGSEGRRTSLETESAVLLERGRGQHFKTDKIRPYSPDCRSAKTRSSLL